MYVSKNNLHNKLRLAFLSYYIKDISQFSEFLISIWCDVMVMLNCLIFGHITNQLYFEVPMQILNMNEPGSVYFAF